MKSGIAAGIRSWGQIVNQLVETYSDEDLRTKFDRTMHVSSWLQKQLDGLKTDASNAQQKLVDYQKAHNIVGTDENSNLTLQKLQEISSSLTNAEADRIIKDVRTREFDSLTPDMVALTSDDPELVSLNTRLLDLETQRAQLATQFAPKYPRIIELEGQIGKIKQQINAEVTLAKRQVRTQYESAAGIEGALRKRLQAQEEEAYHLNEGAAQYAILRNEAELERDLYNSLQMTLKEATVTAGLSAANITVVDSAQVPYIPVAPRKRLTVLMGLVGGFVGGCVLAFLIESIDDRLQTSDEVETVTMLPSLAAIPHFGTKLDGRKKRTKDLTGNAGRLKRQLITLLDPNSLGAEAYRNLRSSILLSSIDDPPRVIVLTSAFPEEGKTTTAINCAIVLAQRGERVLLVDADLRRGTLGEAFGTSRPDMGLTTCFQNRRPPDEIQAPLADCRRFTCCRPAHARRTLAEVLSSARMREQLLSGRRNSTVSCLIRRLPLLSVSDTQALAVLADAVVLVTRPA